MATDELIWRKYEMVSCLWYEYEFDDYEGFSNRFVDNIKFCIANIMGTFLQSDMSLFRLTPFRSKKTLSELVSTLDISRYCYCYMYPLIWIFKSHMIFP